MHVVPEKIIIEASKPWFGRRNPTPKTRFPEGGYPADTRRISGGYPADIRAPEESSGWIFRDVAGASLSPLVGTGRRVAAGGGRYDQTCRRHSPPCSNQWGER